MYTELIKEIFDLVEASIEWDDDYPTEEYEDVWNFVCALRNSEIELTYKNASLTPDRQPTLDDDGLGAFDYDLELIGWRANDFDIETLRDIEAITDTDIYAMISVWAVNSYEEERQYAGVDN